MRLTKNALDKSFTVLGIVICDEVVAVGILQYLEHEIKD